MTDAQRYTEASERYLLNRLKRIRNGKKSLFRAEGRLGRFKLMSACSTVREAKFGTQIVVLAVPWPPAMIGMNSPARRRVGRAVAAANKRIIDRLRTTLTGRFA